MFDTIKRYAGLVKFSHTVFAMPFALIAFFYAYTSSGLAFDVWLLVKIVLCMVFARNAAMGFNRYADRDVDALNPRTKSREIPSGKITPRHAAIFIIINGLLFITIAFFINKLAFFLSPVALIIILGYSLTKRRTWLCHIVLGASLGMAPLGAYIAVTGTIAIVPIILSCLVVTWVSGFDIIYSLQDEGFDRDNKLHSIPERFGVMGALIISALLHVFTIYCVVLLSKFITGTPYIIASSVFIGLLIYQHLIVSPKNLTRVGLAFGTTNGIASVIYGTITIIGFFL